MGATAPGRAGSDEKYWTLAVLTWDDLQRILRDNTLEELARSPEMQQKYGMFKRQLSLDWVSTEDYLLHRYFNFESSTCPERNKLRVAHPQEEVLHALKLVWAPNDFPYSLDSGIDHHCVWAPSRHSATPQALAACIEEHKPAAVWETLYFVNPAHLRSVRDVWHAHVLSRRRVTG